MEHDNLNLRVAEAAEIILEKFKIYENLFHSKDEFKFEASSISKKLLEISKNVKNKKHNSTNLRSGGELITSADFTISYLTPSNVATQTIIRFASSVKIYTSIEAKPIIDSDENLTWRKVDFAIKVENPGMSNWTDSTHKYVSAYELGSKILFDIFYELDRIFHNNVPCYIPVESPARRAERENQEQHELNQGIVAKLIKAHGKGMRLNKDKQVSLVNLSGISEGEYIHRVKKSRWNYKKYTVKVIANPDTMTQNLYKKVAIVTRTE